MVLVKIFQAGFSVSPSYNQKIVGVGNDDPENVSKKPKVDWSCATKKKMSILNVTPYRQS